MGQRRSGGRARRAAEVAVHGVAADADARAERRRAAGGAVRAGAGRRAAAVGITLDYTPVLDILTNPKNPVIGDRALAEHAEDVARLGTRDHRDAAGRRHRRLRQAFSRARRHQRRLAPRAAADRASARSARRRRARAVQGGDRRRRRRHHDRAHPGARARRGASRRRCRRRSSTGLLKEKLGFDGLVFTDDIEMKAISARYGIAEATVRAIAAGCDAVLMCGDSPGAAVRGARSASSMRSRTERCRSSASRMRWRAIAA